MLRCQPIGCIFSATNKTHSVILYLNQKLYLSIYIFPNFSWNPWPRLIESLGSVEYQLGIIISSSYLFSDQTNFGPALVDVHNNYTFITLFLCTIRVSVCRHRFYNIIIVRRVFALSCYGCKTTISWSSLFLISTTAHLIVYAPVSN